MASQNILIGIDLGTTNSEIGLNQDGKVQIIKNVFNLDYTPSIFMVDKNKNKVVGKKAYEKLFRDADDHDISNIKAEVKRLMGTAELTRFDRLGKSLGPEEISAEILIDLLTSVKRKHPDIIFNSAVITIPAAFSTLQSEATQRAGKLAGLEHVVLLQEPIAAAVAYGYDNELNENWLIYDLGGGTFDTALISSRDGLLSVLAHNGDNFLGGKNFDYAIVDQVIVPKIVNDFEFTNFSRSNDAFRAVFMKLKFIAEQAKIELSQLDSTTIEVDLDITDDNGKALLLSIPYTRAELHKLLMPMIMHSINLCKNTITDAGHSYDRVHKVILVGGPTLMPFIRETIEKELRVQVDSSVDPLTIVAKGATIFGLSQKVPDKVFANAATSLRSDTYKVELFYESLTSDIEQTVTGKIDNLEGGIDGYTIQFRSTSGDYAGKRVQVKNGKFYDTVILKQRSTTVFKVDLFDPQGNSLMIQPDTFAITQGLAIAGAPLPHSIGLEVAKKDFNSGFEFINTVERIFDKGAILPIKSGIERFKTTRVLKKGQVDNPLMIKALEGESEIPDRNTYICDLGIDGMDLPYDLEKGSEIEITLSIDESRNLAIEAYVPLFDLSFSARSTVRDEILEVNDLEMELENERERAENIISGCTVEERREVNQILEEAGTSVENARHDEDEKRKAKKQLTDIKVALDRLENDRSMSQQIDTFNKAVADADSTIDNLANDEDKPKLHDQLDQIEKEGEKAIAENNKAYLGRIIEAIGEFSAHIFFSNPVAWVGFFEHLEQDRGSMTDQSRADYLFRKGRLAIENYDIDELKETVRDLIKLLPSNKQGQSLIALSGISR